MIPASVFCEDLKADNQIRIHNHLTEYFVGSGADFNFIFSYYFFASASVIRPRDLILFDEFGHEVLKNKRVTSQGVLKFVLFMTDHGTEGCVA
jgi:hypothetical protein